MVRTDVETEGIEVLKDFFSSERIKFEENVDLKLEGDVKKFRRADFFLPKYGVYVEYFGRWNEESYRKEYKKKRESYKKNKVPCVYLFPDNLGILNFLFKTRIRKVMKKNNLKNELFMYNLKDFVQGYAFLGAILLFMSYYFRYEKSVFVLVIVTIGFFSNAAMNTFFK